MAHARRGAHRDMLWIMAMRSCSVGIMTCAPSMRVSSTFCSFTLATV